MTPEDICILK
jgi:transcriptional regulator with XRE-family HTH domain